MLKNIAKEKDLKQFFWDNWSTHMYPTEHSLSGQSEAGLREKNKTGNAHMSWRPICVTIFTVESQ